MLEIVHVYSNSSPRSIFLSTYFQDYIRIIVISRDIYYVGDLVPLHKICHGTRFRNI